MAASTTEAAVTATAPPPSNCRRILHTMLRVGNLQRSIDFYTKCLGMRLLRTSDFPADEFTLAFLGYNSEVDAGSVIELTYNYGKEKYEHGGAYGHIALGVTDVKAEVERLKGLGVEAGYVSDDYFMAFISDPDGYDIELLNEQRLYAQVRGEEIPRGN
jgi:lactoylglutathione lyase